MASVDTDMAPRATGRAAELAAAHEADHPLKLYGAWFCPFVQRAWMVLAEKRVGHQYVEINPYRKTAGFLRLNPRGLVPTLAVPGPVAAPGGDEDDEDGKDKNKARLLPPLYESVVLCEYVDEAFADESRHGPPLLPADAYARARCRLWMNHVDTRVVPAWYRLMQHRSGSEATGEHPRTALLAGLRALAAEMAEGGPWFLGARFSLVDVLLAPWARRLFLLDHYKPGGVGIPPEGQGGEDEAVWTRWRVWCDAVLRRRSLLDTSSEDEDYVRVYERYAEDTTQSGVGRATRTGGHLP